MAQFEAEQAQLRARLGRGECAPVLERVGALLEQQPDHRDLLYLKAVTLRYLQRSREALQTLDELQRRHPGFARQFQERGYCERSLGRGEAALRAFQRATELNATLHASWKAAGELLAAAGRAAESQQALRIAAEVAALPGPVLAASNHFAEGEIELAEREIREFLLRHGDHLEAMRLLARIGLHHGVLDDAELLLGEVVRRSPQYASARYDYAQVLSRQHKHRLALQQVDELLRTQPANRAYLTLRAATLMGLGQHEAALAAYRALLPGAAQPAEIWLSIGHAHKALGQQPDAIAAYGRARELRPDFGDAWWSLANLKTYRFAHADLALMHSREAQPGIAADDRIALCFALGKAHEDGGEYATSFQYYARGNALKRQASGYSPEAFERTFAQQRAVCTAQFLAARSGWGSPSAEPIFIVGLPRAGSTLLEQILASHSAVEGTMELADIPRLVHELSGREDCATDPQRQRYPALLHELTAEQCRRLGERYLHDTRAYRAGKPHFIDKMPNNFRHLGLIHLILPNARVIDARREPMACCFSNFKQLFASGQEFTYSLEDLGRYYRAYVELMAHWDQVLPGRVWRVQHEALIEDLEGQVRQLLAFCGLEFEPACLQFHKTVRSVRTASSEQVRQPINRAGLTQWRCYESFLGPLTTALGIHSDRGEPGP